jgi:hypothetical protein
VHPAHSRALEAAGAAALRRRLESRQPSVTLVDEHFSFLPGERHALTDAAGEAARAETVRFLLQHVEGRKPPPA